MSMFRFGLYLGRVYSGSGLIWVKLGRNQISFKRGMVQVGFGLSIFRSLRFGSRRFGFELGHVISDMGNFGSWYNSGLVWLWIGLLRVFESKSVRLISGVGSGMDPGHSIRVSG